jgi:hypothetical protein
MCTAFAYTVNLDSNNLGLPGSVGIITVTDNGTNNVLIDLVMNPGYSLKIQDGADFNFNSNFSSLTANIESMTIGSSIYTTGLSDTQKSGQNADGLGSYSINFTGISCGSCPNGTASIDQAVIDITGGGITAANLAALNASGFSWAVHFCEASGGNCSPTTGYAAGNIAPVPLSGTAQLLVTGIACIGLANWKRKWNV